MQLRDGLPCHIPAEYNQESNSPRPWLDVHILTELPKKALLDSAAGHESMNMMVFTSISILVSYHTSLSPRFAAFIGIIAVCHNMAIYAK